MRSGAAAAIALLALAATRAIAQEASPDILDVPPGGAVDGFINGRSAHFFVGHFGLETPYIAPSLGPLAPDFPRPHFCQFDLGRKQVPADGAVVTVTIDGRNRITPACLPKIAFKQGFDAVLGIDAVPQEVVVIHLRDRRSGEQAYTYPIILMHHRSGPLIRVDGQVMNLYFYSNWPETSITAHVAQILAKGNVASLHGPVEYRDLGFGISRPVRRMRFDEPLRFGPLTIGEAMVTTADFGDVNGIDDEDLDAEKRGDAIVVQAKQKKQDPWFDRIRVGASDLQTCSTITFDKRHETVTLSCLPPS